VIGGGAAGFFAAINLAILHPDYRIQILEKSDKLLSKVRISGGGRCNVTHSCFDHRELVKNYPRGYRELLQVFSRFDVEDTIAWFKQHGVELKTEGDGRMFPTSNSSQSIIDCFLDLAEQLKIKIHKRSEVLSVKKEGQDFVLETNAGQLKARALICAMGGHGKIKFYNLIQSLGHRIVEPLPSLFTFNLPGETIIKELQGISVPSAEVCIQSSGLKYQGPVLITHWGLSGPAVLKLSAFAARDFHAIHYDTRVIVNWVFPLNPHETEVALKKIQQEKHKNHPMSQAQFDLPKRLWENLCTGAGLPFQKPWAEISKVQMKALTERLCKSTYHMEGRTTFKEEFVTTGGVELKEVDFKTMQSKLVPNLFFCGEVLDIDGITGGFNFQSAWSTAWIAAQHCKI